LETTPFDRSYTTYYILIELSDVEYYGDLEMWVRGHFNVIENGTIRKLVHTVSYSHSIASMAVSLAISEIFIVKE